MKPFNSNILAILATYWSVVTTIIFIMALAGWAKAEDGVVMLILNALTGILGLILGYYFGSSEGSSKKNDLLGKIVNKEKPIDPKI